jgi:hypothetical protein
MASQQPGGGWALRFISGKYQGGAYPLRDGREVTVGRSPELDLVLAEDLVSRRHARIAARGDEVVIEDLGSTNGTFVNGQKVKLARLSEGDRILVGGSILKLVAAEPGAGERSEEEIRLGLKRAAERATLRHPGGMQGRLEEVPLLDLLQLLGTAKKSGVLLVTGDEQQARLYLQEGRVIACTIDEHEDRAGKKSLYRVLGWGRGSFELVPPLERPVAVAIEEPLEMLLLEGMREKDELRQMAAALPPREARLELPRPLAPPLRELTPAELDLLQLALEHGTPGAVLDQSPQTDLEAAECLLGLLRRGYLLVRPAAAVAPAGREG